MSSSINANQIDIENVTACIKSAFVKEITEEDFSVRISECIKNTILKPLNIQYIEREKYILITGFRDDSLYKRIIIEYKGFTLRRHT